MKRYNPNQKAQRQTLSLKNRCFHLDSVGCQGYENFVVRESQMQGKSFVTSPLSAPLQATENGELNVTCAVSVQDKTRVDTII